VSYKQKLMPMTIDKKIWFLTSIIIINPFLVVAQATDDNPEPPPGADISQYIVFGLIIAIVLAFVILYKNRKLQNKYQINL
jgi:uncharacterized membrane protein